MVNAKIIVSGRVQGVGYRYFCYSKAGLLGLKGYAKNLYNGDVECIVEGEKAKIEEFITLLREGPRASKVTNIEVEYSDNLMNFKRFDTY